MQASAETATIVSQSFLGGEDVSFGIDASYNIRQPIVFLQAETKKPRPNPSEGGAKSGAGIYLPLRFAVSAAIFSSLLTSTRSCRAFSAWPCISHLLSLCASAIA